MSQYSHLSDVDDQMAAAIKKLPPNRSVVDVVKARKDIEASIATYEKIRERFLPPSMVIFGSKFTMYGALSEFIHRRDLSVAGFHDSRRLWYDQCSSLDPSIRRGTWPYLPPLRVDSWRRYYIKIDYFSILLTCDTKVIASGTFIWTIIIFVRYVSTCKYQF